MALDHHSWQPGDRTDDASVPWPDGREQVDVGTLTLDSVESEETSPARDINFDPLVLPAGIAPSDDPPLLSARSAVYSQSFTRRAGEKKESSAITPSDVLLSRGEAILMFALQQRETRLATLVSRSGIRFPLTHHRRLPARCDDHALRTIIVPLSVSSSLRRS